MQGDLTTFFHDLVNSNRSTFNMYARNALKFKGVFSSANEVEEGQEGQWFVSKLEPTIYIFSDGSWHDVADGSSEFSAEQIKNIVTLYIATLFGIVGNNTFIGAAVLNRGASGNSESGLMVLRGIDDNNVVNYNKQAMLLTSDVQFYLFDKERHIYSYGNTPNKSYLVFTPIPKETLGIDCGISEPYAFVARETDGVWYYEHRNGVTIIPAFGKYGAGEFHDEFITMATFNTNGKVIIESTFKWNISVIDISLRNMIYRLVNLEDHVERIFVKTGINELGQNESIYNRLVMNEDETSILMSKTSELENGLEETNSSIVYVSNDLIKLESKTIRHDDANSMIFAGRILPNSHTDSTTVYNRLALVGTNKDGNIEPDNKFIVATPDGTTNEFDKEYINSSTSDTSTKYIVYSEQSITSMALTASGTSNHFIILKNIDEVWYYDTGSELSVLPGDGGNYGEGQYRSYFHIVAEFTNMPGENKILGSSLKYLCHRSFNNYTDVNAAIEINSTSITQRVSATDSEGNLVTLAKIVVANQDEEGYIQIMAESIDIAGVVNFINTDANTSTQISGNKIRTGTIESNVNIGTGLPYSWINLNDGSFSFGDGRISWNGYLLNIEGSVTSYSGIIGGWEITDTHLQSINADIVEHALYIHSQGNIYTKNFSNIAGEEAGFMITKEGNAYFNNIVARGTIYATDGVFNGEVYADNGIFNGKVYATDGVFNGTVNATDGIFNGTVNATDGVFNGTVNATDGVFNGTVNATDGVFSGAIYTNIGEIAGWIINEDSILGPYGDVPNRSFIELNKTNQYIGAYQEADLSGGIYIKIDESGLPYASFGNKMVYSNGNLTFAEGVITWDNLDSESKTNISGYTAEISPRNASVYNNGSSITPGTQLFKARLIKNVDNTEVSGCSFAWSAVISAGTYISSGQFSSTAIISTSSQNGPAIYKCIIEKDSFSFEVSVSISYSQKGDTGDSGEDGKDAVNYWLTANKMQVVYDPNDGTYDGGAESNVVFTAKKSVGNIVSNATGLYWRLNGVSTTTDANGYQKTITVGSSSSQINTIEIYDEFGGQLLDIVTVNVIVAGEDSYSIVLSNEHQTIASDYQGNSLEPSSIVTTVMLFKGTEEITDFTISAAGAVVNNTAKTVTVTPPEGSTMSGQQVIVVYVGGVQIGTKTFTWSKSPQGDPGLDAEIYWLISDKEAVMYDPNDDTYDGAASATVVFTAIKSVGNVISNPTNLYWSLNGSPANPDVNGYQKTITVNSNEVNTLSIYADSAREELLDIITIPVLVAGSDAYSIVLSNEHQTVKCFDDGTSPDPSLISTIVLLYKGVQLQDESSYWIETSDGEANQSFKSVSYTVPSSSTMSGDIIITVRTSQAGSIIGTKKFTWSKSPQGEPGEDGQDAEIYWLFANKDKVVYNPNNNTYDGGDVSTVIFTAGKSTGNVVSNPTNLYWTLDGVLTTPDANLYQKTVSISTLDAVSLSIYKDSSLSQLLDTVTVPVLSEGSNAYSIVLTNEHQTVYAKNDGTSPDPSSAGTGVQLYFGTELLTSYWIEASSGTVDQEFKTVNVDIPNNSTVSGSSTITVKTSEFGELIGTKKFTWSKSNQGDQGIPGEDAKSIRLSATSQIFKADQDNNITSGNITLNADIQNITGTVTWSTTPSISLVEGSNGNEKVVTSGNFGANTAVQVTASIDGYSDNITLVRVQEGTDAIVCFLTNETHAVPTNSDGSSPDFSGATSTMKVFRGSSEDTGWSFAWSLLSGTSEATGTNTHTITITGLSTDAAMWRCTGSKNGFSDVIKDFTVSKGKQGIQGIQGEQGIPGEDAEGIYLTSTSQLFVADQDNNITSDNIVFTANVQNVEGTISWTTDPAVILSDGVYSYQKVLTPANFGSNNSVKVMATIGGYSDYITVVRVRDGSSSITGMLSNESHAITCDDDGNNPDLTGASSTAYVFRGSVDDSINWSYSWQCISGTSEASGTNTRTISISSLDTDVAVWRLTAIRSGFSDITKDFTITKSKQGSAGSAGADAILAFLSNDSHVIPTDESGNNGVFTGCETTMNVYIGSTDDSDNWDYSRADSTYVDSTLDGRTVTVTAMTSDTGYVDITAEKSGYPSLKRRFALSKSKKGIPGESPTAYWLVTDVGAIKKSEAGVYTPTSINVTGKSATGDSSPVNYSGRFIIAETTDGSSWTNKYTSSTNESTKSYNPSAGIVALRIRMYLAGGTSTLLDEEIVPIVSDGPTGPAGADATIYWIESSADYVKYNPNTGTYDPSSITLYAKKRVGNGTPVSTNVYWKINDGAWSASATSSYTINNPTTFTAVIAESSGATESAWLDRYTVSTLVEGSDSYSIILTNEHQTVACDVDGYSPDPSSVSVGVIVFRGTTDITSSCTLYTGATAKSNPFTYTIPNSAAMSGSLDVTVKEGSTTIGNKMFTWSKSEKGDQGNPGANAKIVKLSSTSQVFKEDQDGNVAPSSITFTANLQNIAGNAVFTSNPAGLLTGTGNTRTLTSSSFGNNNSVVVTATADSLSDSITVMRLKEGSDAYSIVLTNENQTVASDPSGYLPTPNTISTQVQLYRGITSVTGFTVEATGASVSENNVTVTIPSNTDLSGEQVILVKVGGVSVGSKKLTWSKSRKGVQGVKGDSNIIGTLDNDSHVVATDSAGNNGVYTGCTTTMYVFDGTTDDTSNWTFTINTSSGVTAAQSGAHNNTVSVSNMTVDTGFVDITAARSGYTSITKRFVISKSKQGPTGIQGPTGQEATSYWMTGAPAAIKKLSDGSFEPNTFTLYGKKATGTSPVTSYTGLLEIKYTNDGSAWNNFSSSQTAYSTSLTFPKNGVSIPSTAVALRARLYYGSSTSDPLIDEEVIPIVSDGNDALSIVLSASTASATFKVNDTWSTTPAPLNIIATAYKGGSAFTGLPATNFSMTGPLETKTVTSVNGSSTFLISTEELTALKNSVNGLANTFVFNIAFTYSGSTYNAAFALNVKNEKFAWLNEWEGYTTIDSKSVATPMIFAGTLNDTTLTGVFIDSNGLVGLNGASNASNPFAQSESYQTFKLLNDGTAKIASFNFDNDFIYGDNIYLSGGSYPMLGINTDYYGTKGIFAGKYSKPSGDIITEPTSVPMNFTSYINGDYEVSSSGNTSTYYSWKALDDSSSTSYRPSSENPWIQIYNKNGIDISAFKIYYYNVDGYKPKHLTVYGSNNGTNFTALYDNNIPEIGYSNALQILEGDYCYKYVRFAFGSSSVTGDPTPDLLRLYQLFIYKRATYPDYGFSLVGDTEYLKWDGSKLTIKAANFELNSDGDITASNVDLSGKITAITGAVGGWTVSGTTLNSDDNVVILDSANKIIKVGSHLRLGKDVVTANYTGLRITADNYWETNGTYTKLSLGGGKLSYDDTSGSAILSIEGKVKATSGYIGGSSSGWIVDSNVLYSGISNTEYSILIDADKSKISIYRDSGMSHPAISLGMDVTATGSHGLAFFNNISGASNNYWIWDTNAVKFRTGDATNYIDFNVSTTNKLSIVTDTFSLATTNMNIDSATEKIAFGNIVLQGGTSPYIGIGTTAYSSAGIWLGKNDSKWKASFYANANNYLLWDSDILTIKAANFTLDSAGKITASSATISGEITAIAGKIGNWNIDTNQLYSGTSVSVYSLLLDSSTASMNIYRASGWTNPSVKIGLNAYDNKHGLAFYPSSGSSTNYWVWDSTNLKFRAGDATNYISFNADVASKLKIKTDTFDLSSNNLDIKSGTSPYIGLGITTYDTNNGIWLGKDTYWKLSMKNSDGTNYLKWDSTKLLIKAANFELNSSGNIIATNVDLTGKITATTGTIGGWDIGTSSISKNSLTINSSTPYIGLGITTYNTNNGIWLGKDTKWKLSMKNSDGSKYLLWDSDKLTIKAANFLLDPAGKITATDVDLSGNITAITGEIGGWTINPTSISSSKLSIVSGSSPYIGIEATNFMQKGFWLGETSNNMSIIPVLFDNTYGNIEVSASLNSDNVWLAFNGNQDIVWNSGAHSNAAINIDVDFGTNTKINVVQIYFPNIDLTSKSFVIQSSSDGDSWTTVSNDCLDASGHSGWYSVSLFRVTNARYYRVLFAANQYTGSSLELGQINFSLTAVYPSDVDKFKTNVVESFPESVMDSNLSASWYGEHESSTKSLSIELEEPAEITSYRFYCNSSRYAYNPKSWTLRGSNDEINWKVVHTVIDHADFSSSTWYSYTCDTPGAYKYYEFVFTAYRNSTYVALTEIELLTSATYGFSMSNGANSYISWNNKLNIKGDLYIGAGKSSIYFEDSGIVLGDNKVAWLGSYTSRYVTFSTKYKDSRSLLMAIGYDYDGASSSTLTRFEVQNRFIDYNTPNAFRVFVNDSENSYFGSINLDFISYSSNRDNQAINHLSFLRDSDTTSVGYFKFDTSLKSVIPEWYGTKTTATTKNPNASSWTDAEDCPLSNIWVWRKTIGTPSKVLYVRLPDGNIWWVSMTEL